MAVSLRRNILRIDLDIASSILNHCDHRGLLTYMSLITCKNIKNIHYINYKTIQEFSLISNQKDLDYALKKLIELKLVYRLGNRYTCRVKKKEWSIRAEKYTPDALTLGGILNIEIDAFYRFKNEKRNLKEMLYLTIMDAVQQGKSVSRKFIREVTGVSEKTQKRIHFKYKDYIKEKEHYIPINTEEKYKIGNIPTINGQFNSETKQFTGFKQHKKRFKMIRGGNKVYVDPLYRFGSLEYSKPKKERESWYLNESVQKRDEVVDWDSFMATIDFDEDSQSKRNYDLVSFKDTRYSTWDKMFRYNFAKINVITETGEIMNIRDYLRRA
jgi:hypothetical protein